MRAATSILILLGGFFSGDLQAQGLSFKKTDAGVEISEGGSKVLFYQIKPKSANGKYERTNYIHPLYSLSGKVLTEDFPEDHPHHRGVFWAWHQIIHNDSQIADGWSCENISWEVASSNVNRKKSAVTLDNEVLWKSSLNGGDLVPIIRETSRITVHSAANEYRFVDFEIDLKPLIENLKIGGSDDAKGYGGFSVRFKLPRDIAFLSGSKRVDARELALESGPWLDFFGAFDGENARPSGVAIFSHPANPGYPEPWILRSAKSMQNPAFPGRHPVDLTEDGIVLRYRLVIHSDRVRHEDLEEMHRDYSQSKFQ